MPGRPSKPIALVKRHNTNAEKEHRIKAEAEKNSGVEMCPSEAVKKNKYASKQFKRLKQLYVNINQNDAMHSETISRYCVMLAEEVDLKIQLDLSQRSINDLQDSFKDKEIDFVFYIEKLSEFGKLQTVIRGDLYKVRKMLYDHERACLFTLADKMRALPKQPPEKTEEESGIERYKRLKNGG